MCTKKYIFIFHARATGYQLLNIKVKQEYLPSATQKLMKIIALGNFIPELPLSFQLQFRFLKALKSFRVNNLLIFHFPSFLFLNFSGVEVNDRKCQQKNKDRV